MNAGAAVYDVVPRHLRRDYEHLDKSGKNKNYTSEVQLASETLQKSVRRGPPGREQQRDDHQSHHQCDQHAARVSEITKTFESSQTQASPKSVAFYVYKKGRRNWAGLEMRVVDAHGTSWQKVTQPITLGGFTGNDRKQSVVVRL